MALFRAMANGNNALQILSLSNNALGNASAAALGELLRTNRVLQELDLSWNQIKASSVYRIHQEVWGLSLGIWCPQLRKCMFEPKSPQI